MFGSPNPTTERFDALMEELADLKRSVAEIKGERKATVRVRDLEKEYDSVKRELTDKQIEFDREQEKWEREKREVEHMVEGCGLIVVVWASEAFDRARPDTVASSP